MLRNTAQGTTNEALLLLEGGSGYKEGSVELFGKAFYPAHSWQGQTIVCVCLSYIPGRLTQLCLTLPNPMDCNSPGSSVHGILQARILEQVAIPFSQDLPDPGIKPMSPALQADSLPSELPKKSQKYKIIPPKNYPPFVFIACGIRVQNILVSLVFMRF